MAGFDIAHPLQSTGNMAGSWIYDNWMGGNQQTAATNAAYNQQVVKSQNAAATRQASASNVNLDALTKRASDAEAAARAAQYALAAQPKVQNFDVAGAYARARSAAEGAVNPFYTKKLNDFLAGQEVKKTRAQEDTATASRDVQQALQDATDASALARERTGQDVTTKLGDIGSAENFFQNQEGTQFDRARQAMLSQGAQSGLLGSGLGTQQDANAIADRNTKSAQQQESFDTQKKATELFKTRTFEDLQRSDTLQQRNTGQKQQQIQVDLDRALQDIGHESEGFKFQNEADRLGGILQEQNRQAKLDFSNFISGLVGKGTSARDIEATANIYGKAF